MKKVEAERYQKRKGPSAEEIDFAGPAIEPTRSKRDRLPAGAEKESDRPSERAEKPSKGRTTQERSEQPDERRNGRGVKLTDERPDEVKVANSYLIEVPEKRVKIRHSFDVFEDQKLALDRLQMATRDIEGEKPNLGEMVQEALDDYIQKRTDELPNVRTMKRTDNRSNEQSAHE